MVQNQERIILHIDVNSAFLSWEAIHRLENGEPDLREFPSVIGGSKAGNRGIVLAKSIPAKKYGVETAEPIYSALKKCPSLVIFPPSFQVYGYYSRELVRLLRDMFPVVEQYSIDECFVDYNGLERIYGDPIQLADKLKDKIKNQLGFTVNIGVSVNKLLAKMGSDLRKPDKVHTLFPSEIEEKMWPLPVGNLYMVGKASAEKLRSLGLRNIGDLAKSNKAYIEGILKKHGAMIWDYANGIDSSKVDPNSHSELQSISNEITLDTNIVDRETAHRVIISLAEKVAMRLRSEKKYCWIVAINIRNSDFKNYSKQRGLEVCTDSTNTIIRTAKVLLDQLWRGEPIRMLGISLSDLSSKKNCQMNLFERPDDKREMSLNRTLDRIRQKYGYQAIKRSCLVHFELDEH